EGSQGRSYEGSGIGLALVQELVKLHGGTVLVESEPGQGSAFSVSIPFGFSHLPQDRIGGSRTNVSTATAATSYVEEALRWLPSKGDAPQTLPKPESVTTAPGQATSSRILLADDNSDMREYVERLLSAEYKVESVGDGQAALEAIRRDPPDLILSDVMMPKLDGYGLVKNLRADERTASIPVILLSARANEEAHIQGMESGADAYLIKPFSARELLAHVKARLEIARIRHKS